MAIPFAPMARGVPGDASGLTSAAAWRVRDRWRGRKRARANRRGQPEAAKVLFEPLEQRYLLSADLSPLVVAMLDQGNELTVRLDSGSDTLQVVNDQTHQVVAQQDAGKTSQIQILGTDRADRLTIDFSTPFGLAGGINFLGGSRVDQLLITGGGAIQAPFSVDAGGATLTNRADLQAQQIALHGGDIFDYGSLLAGSGGRILLQATADGHLTLAGRAEAAGHLAGETGGLVDLLGGMIDLTGAAVVDASGAAGGGTVHIGGSAHGAGSLPNAQNTNVAAGAVIDVSAGDNGDGGNAVIWADGATFYAGSLLGHGGSSGGDGGSAEVSGSVLQFRGSADLGATGSLLLDPINVTIAADTGGVAADDTELTGQNGIPENYNSAGDATISSSVLAGLTGSVSISADNNITLNDLSGTTLTLAASSITFTANADGTGGGTFAFVNSGDTLKMSGGSMTINAATLGTLGSFDVGIGTLTLNETASGDFTLHNVTAGTFNLTGHGDIGEASTIAVTGTTTISDSGRNVTLDSSSNNFGTVVVNAAKDVTLDDTNGIILGSISASNLTVTAGGNITEESGATVNVSNTTTLDAGTHTVDLTGATSNTFKTLDITAGKVILDGNITYTTIALTGVTDISAAFDANMTLTDNSLTIGGNSAITDTVNFTQAELTDPANTGRTLDVSAFTGTATLTGGTGADIFKFGNAFDGDVVQAKIGNNATIDFTANTHDLAKFTVNSDKSTIKDSNTNTLTQVITGLYSAAAQIDVSFDNALKLAFGAFLVDLVNFGKKLDDPNNPLLAELANKIPALKNKTGRISSLAGILGLTNVFNSLDEAASVANGAISEAKFSKLVGDLNALVFSAPAGVDTLGVGFTSTLGAGYRGHAGDNALELTLDLKLKAELQSKFDIDFGDAATQAGVSLQTQVNVDVAMTTELFGGVRADPALSSFTPFIDTSLSQPLSFHAVASADPISGDINLGFLEATLDQSANPAPYVHLDATLSTQLSGIGEISPTSISLINLQVTGNLSGGNALDIHLPIKVSVDGLDAGTLGLLQGAKLDATIGNTLFANPTITFSSLTSSKPISLTLAMSRRVRCSAVRRQRL